MDVLCSEVRLEGLETLDYFDNLMQRERFTEQADAITFDGEVIFFISSFLNFQNPNKRFWNLSASVF